MTENEKISIDCPDCQFPHGDWRQCGHVMRHMTMLPAMLANIFGQATVVDAPLLEVIGNNAAFLKTLDTQMLILNRDIDMMLVMCAAYLAGCNRFYYPFICRLMWPVQQHWCSALTELALAGNPDALMSPDCQYMRRMISQKSKRVTGILCVATTAALQSLQLPALIMAEILIELFGDTWRRIPYHDFAQHAEFVKHWRERRDGKNRTLEEIKE